MVLFGLATVGLGLAFLLVFSAGPFDPGANWLTQKYALGQQLEREGGQDIEFGNVPVSFFRAFTTINGDFDVGALWLRGAPAVAVFAAALLFGNVVLLNLLIAIVSDEFDQFMERAGLEAQLAKAGMCKEAREVMAVRTVALPPCLACRRNDRSKAPPQMCVLEFNTLACARSFTPRQARICFRASCGSCNPRQERFLKWTSGRVRSRPWSRR